MKNSMKTSAFALVMGVLGCASAGNTFAATQVISNANFSISYNDATRFGTASLIGNALNFNLVNTNAPTTEWIAQSVDGLGTATANGTIAMTLTINDTAYANGYRFSAFDWLEGGDYYRDETGSTVAVLGQLRAISTAAPLVTTTTNVLSLASPLSITGINTDWFASAGLDGSTACGGAGCSNVFATSPKQIQLTIENRLRATSAGLSGPGDYTEAFIEKKLGGGAFTLVVTSVPEASTWGMMAAGLLAVGSVVRRRLS